MDISFIIVTYNSEASIYDCLQSIYAQQNPASFEVIVIDNDSQDATTNIIRCHFPRVKLILSDENLGFAEGNNVAMKSALGKIITLVNPDAILHSMACSRISEVFEDSSLNVGVVGGHIENHPVESRPFPSLNNLWQYHQGTFNAKEDSAPIRKVDWICGAFFAFYKSVFEELGGFDPRFFLYYEETDFCLRAKKAGYHCYQHRSAYAQHIGGGSAQHVVGGIDSSNRMIPRFRYFAQLLYFRKHHGGTKTSLAILSEFGLKSLRVIKHGFSSQPHSNNLRKDTLTEIYHLITAAALTRLGSKCPQKPWRPV
jgi:N-acetylglucosaminyl-diphospho-decaprenol L-rhamnosyltransferase